MGGSGMNDVEMRSQPPMGSNVTAVSKAGTRMRNSGRETTDSNARRISPRKAAGNRPTSGARPSAAR